MQDKPKATERRADRKSQGLNYAKLAERASGTSRWLPLAAIFVVALFIFPIIWMFLAHLAGIPLNSGANVSDMLATIGGLMGAIFTVGGLIIGLVSVLTQLSIESRIRRGFKRLLPELDERAKTQIEAYIAFTRADGEHDWRRAEELANEALEKWPSLKGVRSLIGERISNLVMEWFVSHEIEGQRLTTTPFHGGDDSTAFGVTSIAGLDFTVTPSPLLFMTREQVPFYDALDWLKEAINHGEDADASLRARVALVQGTAGHFEDMKTALQETLKRNGSLRDYFLEPRNLAMLVYACRNAPSFDAGLKDIGTLLKHQLPVTASDLLKTLREADMSSLTSGGNVYWVALERPGVDWSMSGKTPNLVTLHILLSGLSDERTGNAYWQHVGGSANGSIPEGMQPIKIAELVERLSRRFILVCQFQPGLTTWRTYQ